MFAIVETGGNQYKVTQNNIIDVEKLDVEEGKKVTLNKVLLVQKDDGKSLVGDPFVKDAKVEVEVVKQFRDEKVISFKKRRRKNSRRVRGHRQSKTTIKILNIVA